jgi:YHS domain-containing protein
MILATAHILISGCAPLPPIPPANAPVQQCLVCRYKRDFSCLSVPATASTPHTQHAGRTYWFCSENCRCEFEKRPAPFLPKS